MPATCWICETTIGFEKTHFVLGSGATRDYHGVALDGTWCSPRYYRLAYPPPWGGADHVEYQWEAERFLALPRVGSACPTCGVSAGKYHHQSCDQELCPRHTSTPLVSCGCNMVVMIVASTVIPSHRPAKPRPALMNMLYIEGKLP
jgi:hypothetical protein